MKNFRHLSILFVALWFGLSVDRAALAADPAKCVYVSDWDDTLKISHSNNAADTVGRSIFSERTFAGGLEFLRAMEGTCDTYLLSDSPTLLGPRVRDVLEDAGVPLPSGILLRNWLRQKKATFKASMLETLLVRYPNSTTRFVFVGDDTEQDPDIYGAFVSAHPELRERSSIFIHRINQSVLADADETGFTIYPELAEKIALRLGLRFSSFDSVSASFLSAELRDVIPPFAKCPGGDLSTSYQNPAILAKLRAACKL